MLYATCDISLVSAVAMRPQTLFLIFISFTLNDCLEVRPCAKRPLPLSVDVDNCEKEPCKVINKKHIHFSIDFIVVRPTTTLTASAKAFLEDVLLPYEVPKNRRDACQHLKNANCPLEEGQKVHYELVAPVDAPMAGPTVDMQFELVDDSGKDVFCLKAKVMVV